MEEDDVPMDTRDPMDWTDWVLGGISKDYWVLGGVTSQEGLL